MIWYKLWLESRARFLGTALALTLVVSWSILTCDDAMARYDKYLPITFTQYVARVYAGPIYGMYALLVFILGLGGLLRERDLGTASYTLSLPISRTRWMTARAAIGIIQSAVLSLIPAIMIPLTANLASRSYPVSEAMKHSTVLFAMGIAFFCAGLLYSSILPGEFAAPAAGIVSIYFVFRAFDYFSIRPVIDAWPWLAMLICLTIAVSFYLAATRATQRIDF